MFIKHIEQLPAPHLLIQQIASIEAELFDDAWNSAGLLAMLEQFGAGLLLAMENDKLLGYCVYQIVFEVAEILRIGTAPSEQGRGVATALLGEFIALCQSQEAQRILLEVRADNTPAIGLYRRFGFGQIDVRQNYYRTKAGVVDALIMQKNLDESVIKNSLYET